MLGSSSKLKIRKARVSDAKALADVFKNSWLDAYRGIIPHLHLDSLIRRRGAAWWAETLRAGDTDTVLVLEVAGKVAGYATLGRARLRGIGEGEIYELYLDPSHQGLGLGELLFEGCRATLDQRSLNGLVVWALSGNTLATGFYWRRGGRPVARMYDRMGGAKLEKVAYAWP